MIRISTDNTCHVENHKPIYEQKYINVMNFHDGIAAVRDESGAYHIDTDGKPTYNRRFIKTFGYYEGLAAAVDESGAYHIDLEGKPAYTARFRWTGNFQGGRCPVRTEDGSYSSIDHSGKQHVTGVGYIGDYSEGKTIVRGSRGCTYADKETVPDDCIWHLDCTNYCNGRAFVSEGDGYFLIDEEGNSLDGQRFERIVRYDSERIVGVDDEGYLVDNGRKTMRIGSCINHSDKLPRWTEFVKEAVWDSCIVFLRHGNRTASSQSDSHDALSKPLTKKGIEKGCSIWDCIRTRSVDSLKAYSSPVERCIASAKLITGGTVPVEVSNTLGLPGTAFINNNDESDITNELPLMFSTLRHIEEGICPGWYPIQECAENILKFFEKDLQCENSLALAVSHDAFVARLIGAFMREYPADSWFDYYEGIILYRIGTETYAWYNGKSVSISEALSNDRIVISGYRENRLEWVGEACEGIRTFRDVNGKYGHLTEQEHPITNERFDYAGDMKYSLTVVGNEGKGFTYLTDLGQYPIDKWFLECTPFHKGYATARDSKGWYHIDLSGNQLYSERYAYAEPFYNEVALCRDFEGNWYLVHQEGGSEIIIPTGEDP